MSGTILSIVFCFITVGIFLIYRNNKPNVHNISTIPILMYHQIVENDKKTNLITITKERFRKDMKYLERKGYSTISFKELIDYKKGLVTLPKKPIIITFDDGHQNNYDYAYPILKEKNMKAAIFIIGSRMGIKNYKDLNYAYLSWNQAKEMYDSGLIEIQPHSYDLHYYKENDEHGRGILKMTDESNKEYKDRFTKDTEEIIKAIRKSIGCKSYVYAYPYGEYEDLSEEVLKELNFKVTLTTKSKYADISNDLYVLKRINVPSHKKLEQLLIDENR